MARLRAEIAKMSDREAEILKGATRSLISYLNPSKIILFGSRAKETNRDHSDFDFAVDCKKPQISVQREINKDIEKISGLYKVDVVYMSSIEEEFKNIILKTGKVIYERRN